MLKGCLLLVVVFAAALWFEKREMDRCSLPGAWVAAMVLAGGVTLVAGSLQGLVEAWRTKAAPEHDSSQWHDGQLVRLSGVIKSAGRVLQAPFSGREAVVLWYNATTQHWDAHNRKSRPSFRGLDLAPCFLESASGRLDLTGMPNFRLLPEEQFSGAEHLDRAAIHLARTKWSAAPEALTDTPGAAEGFSSGGPDALPVNIVNSLGREVLGLESGEPSADELRRRLAERNWLLRERILAPGMEVTVVGTFRAAPASVDVSYGPSSAQHAITPGRAAVTASRNFSRTLIFVFLLTLMTAAGHYLVFGSGGALYRALLERVTSG